MPSSLLPIDVTLDEWGSRLFNLPRTGTRGAKPTAPRGSSRRSTGSALVTPQARADSVRQKLRDLVRRTPQVMVKLTSTPKGMRGIGNNLTYISRDGQLEIEDQDGQRIVGKDALQDLKAEWREGGEPIPPTSTFRDAFHLVLSMPRGTDPLAVKRAVRDFAAREFTHHQYGMVLHTFETDPDPHPSPNPHVHLTVKAAQFDGTRLNPRKADLQRWREGFAQALREHGIEATTTSRLHRTTYERWMIRHLRHQKPMGDRIKRQKRQTARPGRAHDVMRNYEQVMRALARSERPEDRQLAVNLVRYFVERTRRVEKRPSRER